VFDHIRTACKACATAFVRIRGGRRVVMLLWLLWAGAISVSGYAQQTQDAPTAAPNGFLSAEPAAGPGPVTADLLPAASSTNPVAGAVHAGPVDDVSGNPSAGVQGEIGALLSLIRDPQLKELHTVYIGEYGTSLFLYAPDVTYYVALFQNKRLWRVISTSNAARADAIFARFSDQSKRLAAGEINVALAAAQQQRYEKQVASMQARLDSLHADLEVEREQSATVNQRQQQVMSETNALRVEQGKSREQLRALRERASQLQRQLEGGLR
jgi:hypothetical protein